MQCQPLRLGGINFGYAIQCALPYGAGTPAQAITGRDDSQTLALFFSSGDALFPHSSAPQGGRRDDQQDSAHLGACAATVCSVNTFALRAALAVLALGQFGPTRAETLVEEIPRLLEQYSRLGDFQLPSLSVSELHTLAAGEPIVALFREPTAQSTEQVDAMRVVGWQVVDAPRLLVWLSALGGSEVSSARPSHAVLMQRAAGAYVSYHHVDLPWPFKDRQWTLLSEKNPGLAEDSHDVIWEHRWSLLTRDDALLEAVYEQGRIPGVTRRVLKDSVYLSENRGAWIVFDLGASGTLVAASMDVDAGGQFPDALVRSFAKRQLRAFFESVSALRGMHYSGTPLIHDGRGLPIAREAAITAARFQSAPPRLVNASTMPEGP